jgi:hypothetical protein
VDVQEGDDVAFFDMVARYMVAPHGRDLPTQLRYRADAHMAGDARIGNAPELPVVQMHVVPHTSQYVVCNSAAPGFSSGSVISRILVGMLGGEENGSLVCGHP